jgi:hypothetical protein
MGRDVLGEERELTCLEKRTVISPSLLCIGQSGFGVGVALVVLCLPTTEAAPMCGEGALCESAFWDFSVLLIFHAL